MGTIVWIAFIGIILLFLAIDLGVFNRHAHVINAKEAGIWSSIWVSISLLFSIVIYWLYSQEHVDSLYEDNPMKATIKYLTGYLVELSLSVDNIFVIAVIFQSLAIPAKYQHRVLFWGILGAIVFRALMIIGGIALIQHFDWMIYIFGAFLIFTAFRMLMNDEKKFDPKKSLAFRLVKKFIPVTNSFEGHRFLVRKRHILAATPLFVALIMIEFTDILFALDSIPAILAITKDPFLVFSSNIMAILGLRSMYFLLANLLDRFHYLKYSLVVLLVFVGIKMLLEHYYDIPEWFILIFILVTLSSGVIFSLYKTGSEKKRAVKTRLKI